MTNRLTYFSRQASTHVGALGNNNLDLERTPTTSNTGNAGATANWYFYSPSNDPNVLDWNGGTYTWYLRITTANSNFRLDTVTLHRLNSARTSSLASKSSAALNITLSSVATHSGTITWDDGTQNPGGRSASDTFALQIQITKTGGHGGDAITIGLGGLRDTRVITPLATSTTLYFHAATDSTSGLPSTEQSTLAAEDSAEAQSTNRSMTDTIGTSQTSIVYSNITPSGVDGRDIYWTKFVSPPLDMTSIPAAGWIYNFAASQSAAAADFPSNVTNETFNRIYMVLYVWRPSTTTKVGDVFDSFVSPDVGYDENPDTSERVFHVSFSGSSVASVSTNDVLIFELWHEVDSASGTRTGTVFYDGTTENLTHLATVSNHASFIEPNGLELTFAATGETFSRPVSDTINLSETIDIPLIGRAAVDTVTLNETIQRLATFQRTVSDAPSLSETIETHVIRPRSVSDTISLSETTIRLLTALRTPSDTVILSETVTRLAEFFRLNLQDTINLSETIDAAKLFLRQVDDTVNLSETVQRVYTAVRTAQDTVSLNEQIERIKTAIRNLNDTTNLSDTVQKIATFIRNPLDTISLSDTVQRIFTALRQLSDTIGLSEAIDAIKNPGGNLFTRNVSDTITTSETIQRLLTAIRNPQDTVTLSDTVQRLFAALRTLSDTTSLSESVQANKLTAVLRQVQDTIVLSESVQRIFTAARSVQDTIGSSENVQRVRTVPRSVSDSITTSDTIQRLATYLRNPIDTITVNDLVQRFMTAARTASDSITLSDTVQKFKIFPRFAADTITIADTIQRLGSFARTISDITNISESIQATLIPLIPPSIPRIFRRISLRKVKGSGRKVKGLGQQVKGSSRQTKGFGRKAKGSGKTVNSEEEQ